MLFQQNTATLYHNEYRLKQYKKVAFTGVSLIAVAAIAMMPEMAWAAGGLSKAGSALEKFQNDIKPVIRVVAVLALMLTGAAYFLNMVDKSTFFKIVVGILIIGSANEIVDLFWT